MDELKERCNKMISELGITKTNFCKNIGIVYITYYDWLRDKLDLSDATKERIDRYLKKYGF